MEIFEFQKFEVIKCLSGLQSLFSQGIESTFMTQKGNLDASNYLHRLISTLSNYELLYDIIVKWRIEYQNLEQIIIKAQTTSKSEVDEFIFHNGIGTGWIKRECRYRINLKYWRKIIQVISNNEILLIQEWINENKSKYNWLRDIVVPLPYL